MAYFLLSRCQTTKMRQEAEDYVGAFQNSYHPVLYAGLLILIRTLGFDLFNTAKTAI